MVKFYLAWLCTGSGSLTCLPGIGEIIVLLSFILGGLYFFGTLLVVVRIVKYTATYRTLVGFWANASVFTKIILVINLFSLVVAGLSQLKYMGYI
jgi:hypothetical protein